ncbi:MAG: hypothetical protein WCS70_09665 [Verrucomicrobiota bacterium]
MGCEVSTGPTWESREEMRRGMMLMLQGTPYFAWQLPDGSYRPCRHVEQVARFESGIFDGTHTAGFYSIRPDNLCRWGALDFDNHDGSKSRDYWLPHAQRAFEILKGQFAEVWLLETSPGGFHVIPFAEALMLPADMRRILAEIAPAGMKDLEIFPKHDKLTPQKPMGFLLRFPGKHQHKGHWGRFLARSGHVQEVGGVTPAPKPARFEKSSDAARFESLYQTVTRGLNITGTRQRFNAMQIIMARLKGRTLDEKTAVDVHDRFYNQHRARIQTPIEKSRAYSLTWFRKAAPCNALPDYPPTEAEQAYLDALPPVRGVPFDRLAGTVRLFLSAKKHADATGRELFLSLPTIAERLGVSIASASNYRNACYRLGLIEMVERGRYSEGKASTYKPGKDWPK